MTDQELNKRVAELLGWAPRMHPHDGLWSMADAHDNLVGRHPHGGIDADHCWRVCNLDFANDHNAVAEMRKAIREDERNQFARYVCDLAFTGNEDCRAAYYWNAIDATPRIQSEAFVALRGGGK